MAELQELLFGLKPNEPIPAKFEELARELRSLEKLASFVETENPEVPDSTPRQMKKIREDEVANKAGGYVFKIDDLTRIRRFLILGTTGGTYYASEKELTMENIKFLCDIIQRGKGLVVLREILDISLSGRAPKQDSTMFALALCARYKVCDTKNNQTKDLWDKFSSRGFIGSSFSQQAPLEAYLDYQKGLQLAALHAVPKVCRIPTHLFMFLKYCKLVSSKTGFTANSTGWGRAMRETISNWYFNIDPERLAILVTKYQNREGYSHRDLFRLCHIAPKVKFPENHNYWKYHVEYDFLFNFIVHGLNEGKKRKVVEGRTDDIDQHSQEKQKVEGQFEKSGIQDAEVCAAKKAKLDKENQIEEIKRKMQSLFKEKWEKGLDSKTRKTIKEKMQEFIDETSEKILVHENIKAEKRKKVKAGESLVLQEKKKPMPQNLEDTKTYKFITAFQELKKMTNAEDAVAMIKTYGFVREHIPTDLLNSQLVWGTLLEDMPMTAMIRNLGKMASVGLLSAQAENKVYVDKVVAKLTDEKALKEARIHPVGVLLASSVYKAGVGIRGKLNWESVPEIKDALEKAFLMAFKNVTPTHKRYCLALDVSGSMGAMISGTHLSCRDASAALSMVLLRTEPEVQVVAFSDQLTEINFDKSSSMEEIIQRTHDLPYSSTDCALPMLWALEKKKQFDVFVVYTDYETWYGNVHPFEALKNYRKEMELPDARLIVMGMTATEFSIADPTDSKMLDVCGFDSAVPELIKEFVLGRV